MKTMKKIKRYVFSTSMEPVGAAEAFRVGPENIEQEAAARIEQRRPRGPTLNYQYEVPNWKSVAAIKEESEM